MLETSHITVLPEPPAAQAFFDALPGPGVTVLPAAPLMHGTACWFVLPILARGGTVVTLTGSSLDPVELLDALQDGVKGLCIVGEAFARPLLRLLDEDPDRWDLSGVRVLFSSGAVLGAESKRRLPAPAPQAQLVDGLGPSESASLARLVSTRHDHVAKTGRAE